MPTNFSLSIFVHGLGVSAMPYKRAKSIADSKYFSFIVSVPFFFAFAPDSLIITYRHRYRTGKKRYRAGSTKAGDSKGSATPPLQIIEIYFDVICYSGRKEIPYRGSQNLSEITAQPSKKRNINGEKYRKFFQKTLDRGVALSKL